MADPIIKQYPDFTAATTPSDSDLLAIYQGASPLKKITWAEVVEAIGAQSPTASRAIVSIGFIGDSITAGAGDGSSYAYRYVNLNGQYYMAANYAVSGATSQDIIDDQLDLVLALSPSHCFTQFGTNDIAQGVDFDDLVANAQTIWNALIGAGIQPVHMGLQPVDDATDYAQACGFNLWARQYCRSNGILYLDILPRLSLGGVGGFKSGLGIGGADHVHPSSVGAKFMAEIASGQTQQTYAVTPPMAECDDRTFGGITAIYQTLQPNAVSMVDTDVDGIPNSFFSVGSGGTYTIQAQASDGLGKWARVAMTGGANVGIQCTAQNLVTLGWEIGDTIAVAYRIRWVDVNQALTISSRLTGITAGAGGTEVFTLFNEQAGTNSGDDMFIYREFVITGGTAIGYNWYASGTGYFEINRPQIFNLTKMGL